MREKPLSAAAFGQVRLKRQRASLDWLLSCQGEDAHLFACLLDNLSLEAGLHGARLISARAPHDSALYQFLRIAGYRPYSWERLWQVNTEMKASSHAENSRWQTPMESDIPALLQFQRAHLPPALRSVIPPADEQMPEQIWKEDGRILAYVNQRSFAGRMVFTPLFDPALESPLIALSCLVSATLTLFSSVYFLQTSGHDWLESRLESMAEPVLPRVECLVKHFTLTEKLPVSLVKRNAENGQPDPVAPFLHSSKPEDTL